MDRNTTLNTTLADYAQWAHDLGYCVVPPSQDGNKKPVGNWKAYQQRMTTNVDVAEWYANPKRTGIGIVCGAISGALEMFECEGRAVDSGIAEQFIDLAAKQGLDCLPRIAGGYSESTPSGGFHWLYRVDGKANGSTKLAQRPATPAEIARSKTPNDKWRCLIETKGEGGYTIIAPSYGTVHETRQPWTLEAGGLDTVATITEAERDALYALARTFDLCGHTTPAPARSRPLEPYTGDPRPGDDYAARTTWTEILEPRGWTLVGRQGAEEFWRRPGKNRGHSATVNYDDKDGLYVFSSSTPFEPGTPYNKFGAYTLLNHDGDFKAAARELARQGYGTQSEPLHITEAKPPRQSKQAYSIAPANTDAWAPVDLAATLANGVNREKATLLHRIDGVTLFYPGKLQIVYGEWESCKSWLALLLVAERLNARENVLWLDYEDRDNASTIVNRLRALGTADDLIGAHLRVIHPDGPIGMLSDDRFNQLLDGVTVIVVDACAESASMEGFDPMSNPEMTRWQHTYCARFLSTGAALIVIDHAKRDQVGQEAIGRGAIGAQHKMAMTTGASYELRKEKPFGHGMHGIIKIWCVKDRHGGVRKHCKHLGPQKDSIGELHLIANEDGTTVTAEIRPHTDEDTPFRPTGIMEKISRYMERNTGPVTRNQLHDNMHTQAKWVGDALDRLTAEHHLARTEHGAYTLTRRYREATDNSLTT